MITYSSKPTLEFGLGMYNTTAQVDTAIDNIQFSAGSTDTGAALQMLRMTGFKNDRPAVPNIAIIITDGLSSDTVETQQQARLAKNDGSIVIAIGVGNQTNQAELNGIASTDNSTGKSLVYEVSGYQELKSVQEAILRYACNVAGSTNPGASTTTPPSNVTEVQETCFDTISNCRDYGIGMCYDYKPWATAHCNRFCGFCQPKINVSTTPVVCVNSINNCNEYGTYICSDSSLSKWTEEHCAEYCGLCGPIPTESTTTTTTESIECTNKLSNCVEYGADVCTNSFYHGWANSNCRKFCGFCGVTTTTPLVTSTGSKTCPEWRLPKACKLVKRETDCCPFPECPSGYVLTVQAPNEV